LGLGAITGKNTSEKIYIEADLNKDDKIGLEETLYSLQIGSAVRRPAFPLQGYIGVTIQHGYPDSYALAISTSIPFSSSRSSSIPMMMLDTRQPPHPPSRFHYPEKIYGAIRCPADH